MDTCQIGDQEDYETTAHYEPKDEDLERGVLRLRLSAHC
jgi:hypothetical protein